MDSVYTESDAVFCMCIHKRNNISYLYSKAAESAEDGPGGSVREEREGLAVMTGTGTVSMQPNPVYNLLSTNTHASVNDEQPYDYVL